MKQIVGINHVGLRVRNLDDAVAFYRKLGFQFVAGPIGPEPVAVMAHPAGIVLNFILNATAGASAVNLLMDVTEKHTGYTHIALEVHDQTEVERQLWAADIPVTEAVDLDDGTRMRFVRDPDGNVIEFHQPA